MLPALPKREDLEAPKPEVRWREKTTKKKFRVVGPGQTNSCRIKVGSACRGCT